MRDRPVTASITGSYTLSPALTVYGGYVRGFEEVAAAPQNASNRGAVPPAIRTRQTDLGLRYAMGRNLNLVAGVFEIAKPYYNLDEAAFYRDLGASSNRRLEVSLAGTVMPGFSVVLGNVLIDSRISGELVGAGRIGPRPVGTVRRRTIANIDWRFANGDSPLSVDVGFEGLSARVANPSNTLVAPPRETVDFACGTGLVSELPVRCCDCRWQTYLTIMAGKSPQTGRSSTRQPAAFWPSCVWTFSAKAERAVARLPDRGRRPSGRPRIAH